MKDFKFYIRIIYCLCSIFLIMRIANFKTGPSTRDNKKIERRNWSANSERGNFTINFISGSYYLFKNLNHKYCLLWMHMHITYLSTGHIKWDN